MHSVIDSIPPPLYVVQRCAQRDDADLASRCDLHLNALVTGTAGVSAALLVGADGAPVAASDAAIKPGSGLPALAWGLLLLGRTALDQAKLGCCTHLVVEAAAGQIVMMPAGDARRPWVLAVVTAPDAMLGHVLWATRRCRDALLRGLPAAPRF